MSIFWIPVVSVIGGIVMIIIMVDTNAKARTRKEELRAQVQMKLIDRFGTANEFVDFVQSNEGKEFLTAGTTKRRATGALSGASVLGGIGLAFLILSFAVDHGFIIPALILLGIAGGLFGAAVLSAKLARDLDQPQAQ